MEIIYVDASIYDGGVITTMKIYSSSGNATGRKNIF